ncbi:MAG: hypothetical protein PHT02_00620 [Tissierellia bacterium]|nr:hypothetical protein [Tissierellia bacterium]
MNKFNINNRIFLLYLMVQIIGLINLPINTYIDIINIILIVVTDIILKVILNIYKNIFKDMVQIFKKDNLLCCLSNFGFIISSIF